MTILHRVPFHALPRLRNPRHDLENGYDEYGIDDQLEEAGLGERDADEPHEFDED